MLTLHDASCDRRRFLTAGSLALSGLSLSTLESAKAAAETANLLTGRSVVFVFQQGGPSQFETFDPKPDASSDIRTIGGITPTSIPGVHFGATMRQLAQVAHKLTIVRSFQTGNAEHNIRPIVGPESMGANIGSLYARVAGATHPETAVPATAVLFPQSSTSGVANGSGRGDMTATGALGSQYAPFVPGGTSQLLRNLRLNLSPDRFHDRQTLLSQFNAVRSEFENEPAYQDYGRNQQRACESLMNGRVADALDLSQENSRVLARYDTSRYAAADNWSSANRGRRGYYTGHAKSLGRSMLMARRLCDAGCGFVTVHSDYEGVWDWHADQENVNVADGCQAIGRTFDHAIAAFIADVEARGLEDKILLICTGEMGRTPRINRTGGRDHWARLAPLLIYGGGLTGGRVIGQSTRDGGEPISDGFTSANLISTILHSVFDVPRLRLHPALAAISRLAEPTPIVY